jgi:hypothetical protein
MKFIHTLLLLALICYGSASAQNASTSIKPDANKPVLPHAGSFGIGLEASPLFNYVGNLMSGGGTNGLNPGMSSIFLKYYLTDMSAVRAILYANSSTSKASDYVTDDAALSLYSHSTAQVIDLKTNTRTNLGLSLAYQKYIGKKRLRGFYGGQLLTTYQSNGVYFTYGNPMNVSLPKPTTSGTAGSYYSLNERLLSNNAASVFKFGMGGIAGIECYILPQVCIGGEISTNLIFTHFGQSYMKTEQMIGDQYVEKSILNTAPYTECSFVTSSFVPNDMTRHLGFYVMFQF